MHPSLPPWPDIPPRHGAVALRAFADSDLPMVVELATDPHVPLVSTLPACADGPEATAWIARQQDRYAQGVGFSFAITETRSGTAVGQIGLWPGAEQQGRASVGYFVAPSARGRGLASDALRAVTGFAWSIPALHRLEAYIEPANVASARTAQRAGYEREGLLRSHTIIDGTGRDMELHAAIRPGGRLPDEVRTWGCAPWRPSSGPA